MGCGWFGCAARTPSLISSRACLKSCRSLLDRTRADQRDLPKGFGCHSSLISVPSPRFSLRSCTCALSISLASPPPRQNGEISSASEAVAHHYSLPRTLRGHSTPTHHADTHTDTDTLYNDAHTHRRTHPDDYSTSNSHPLASLPRRVRLFSIGCSCCGLLSPGPSLRLPESPLEETILWCHSSLPTSSTHSRSHFPSPSTSHQSVALPRRPHPPIIVTKSMLGVQHKG